MITSTSSVPATPSTADNVYEAQRSAGVTALLDSFSRAVVRGDRRAVAALLDESAPAAFRNRLMVVTANFADDSSASESASSEGRGSALRPAVFRYQLAPTEEAEALVSSEVQEALDEQGSSDSWVAPVELHHALGGASKPGLAEPEMVDSAQLVVARYGDSWKIVGDATLAGRPAADKQMWDLPGLEVRDVRTAGGESVIASYPDTATEVGRLQELLGGAVTAVTDFWGTAWPQRALVVATARDAEFEALAPGSVIGGAAAATVYDRIDARKRVAVGQRVVLTPEARSLPTPALGVVMRHELTHVAARLSTAVGAPMWITEGVPEYVGRKDTYRRFADAAPELAAEVTDSGPPAAFPSDAAFAAGGDASQLAYQSAWSIAAYVAQRYGETRLKQLYLGVASTVDVGRQDAAIATVLGITRAELVSRWQRWLTEQVR
ncbi:MULTISPECIES: peptidase MA family metallohydrolase [unclassified Gordonia (in: high G+C Gram-positive bacteria)]|uniref:peptidase MA family metallohydrolase n=1 Tax=unclassified Gordonia (in: high G+C Gram-positive bacteria) TaxID=2657482 RepID=UPI001F0EAEB0|nr:hypothetical protein [Gordonia sp. ABSL49_1]MCH5644509.1 hypothetical protein [Gordonia sp. ABSL49_1]